jgi:hypothetical protein
VESVVGLTHAETNQIVERAQMEYKHLITFLNGQDKRKEPQDMEIYEQAVKEYVLLHTILGIKTEPKWNY